MTLLYFAASAIGLVAAAWCYRANAPYRGMIEKALGPGLMVPERVSPVYGAEYLNNFIRVAGSTPTPLGKSVLDLYIRPVLLWIDVGFAIFCAGFAALFWLGVLQLSWRHVWLEEVFRFFLTMALLYGLADVAEDLWLFRLLSRKSPVNSLEGLIACVLTQAKLLTIILSVVGGLVFQVLSMIFPKPK
jgi:hypothetical protein